MGSALGGHKVSRSTYESMVADRDRWMVQAKAAETLNTRYRETLELIRDTDLVDAALDPDRAVRVAREALSSPADSQEQGGEDG